jgi:hypothetical protein
MTDACYEVIAAFRRALNQEAHVLTGHPGLLWQQLFNRLQWREGPVSDVVESVRAHRASSGAPPWVHLRTPLREATGVLRTLKGHGDWVRGCAISHDGAWVVSAAADATLRCGMQHQEPSSAFWSAIAAGSPTAP